jgi:hypothetical protein
MLSTPRNYFNRNTQSKHIIWRSGANNRWRKYLPISLKYTMIKNTQHQRFLRPRYNSGQLELYFSTAGYSTCQAVGRSVWRILCQFFAISVVLEVVPKITPIILSVLHAKQESSKKVPLQWTLRDSALTVSLLRSALQIRDIIIIIIMPGFKKIFDRRIHINRNLQWPRSKSQKKQQRSDSFQLIRFP